MQERTLYEQTSTFQRLDSTDTILPHTRSPTSPTYLKYQSVTAPKQLQKGIAHLDLICLTEISLSMRSMYPATLAVMLLPLTLLSSPCEDDEVL
jgi:hypothetical protein